MDIYLTRHPKVNLDAGICYGWSEVDLAMDSPEAIQSLRTKLPDSQNLHMISSPLRRCLRVAQALSPNPIEVRNEIRELNFGDWELKAWNEINPASLKDWTSDFVSHRCPNGESYRELHERVGRFWEELMQSEFKIVVVITHAGVIRSLLARILEIPLKNSFTLKVDPNSVTKVIRHKTYFTVEYINR